MVGIDEKLQIQIFEHNNEVFPIFVRYFGSKLKSGDDIVLVRFDSYADFLVPTDLQADEIERLDKIVDSIDNQSWILPAVYRGYITKILWFKPPWAHQFKDGKYQLQVGKCQQTGVLKIASTIPYFTSNCVYSSNDKLSNIHTVEIFIATAGLAHSYPNKPEKEDGNVYDQYSGSESLDSDSRKKVKLSTNDAHHQDTSVIEEMINAGPYLVDIDLSFFSTDDSIRKQFDEQEYEVLRYVYARVVQETNDSEICQYITARQSVLDQIRTFMEEYLTEPKPEQPIVIDNPYLTALIGVIRHKKLDWKAVHNYGMHLADTRPPLHVSSEEMVIYLVEAASRILKTLKREPIMITISRCVDDGFCSSEQADLIQRYVEKKLRKLYKVDQTLGKSLYTQEDEKNDDEDEKAQKITKEVEVREEKRDYALTTDQSIAKDSNVPKKSPIAENSKLQNVENSSTSEVNISSTNQSKAISPSSLSEASPKAN